MMMDENPTVNFPSMYQNMTSYHEIFETTNNYCKEASPLIETSSLYLWETNNIQGGWYPMDDCKS